MKQAIRQQWRRFLLCGLCVTLWSQAVDATPLVERSREARLFDAIDAGKEVVAEGMLAGATLDLARYNAEHETALHRAVDKNMLVLTRALLRAGAPVMARTRNGETVLHYAALHADPTLTRLLLQAGSEVNAVNADGETPLQWASLSGNAIVAHALLLRDADPTLADRKGNRALHAAVDSGNVSLVRALVRGLQSLEMRNAAGQTPLALARTRGHQEVITLLESLAREYASSGGGFHTIDIDEQLKRQP